MADEANDSQDTFMRPVWVALLVVGLFFDVATLMVRMLINTLVYDTPHGKMEATEGSKES